MNRSNSTARSSKPANPSPLRHSTTSEGTVPARTLRQLLPRPVPGADNRTASERTVDTQNVPTSPPRPPGSDDSGISDGVTSHQSQETIQAFRSHYLGSVPSAPMSTPQSEAHEAASGVYRPHPASTQYPWAVTHFPWVVYPSGPGQDQWTFPVFLGHDGLDGPGDHRALEHPSWRSFVCSHPEHANSDPHRLVEGEYIWKWPTGRIISDRCVDTRFSDEIALLLGETYNEKAHLLHFPHIWHAGMGVRSRESSEV